MGATDTWQPDQYRRFQAERDQPFVDLLALVDGDGALGGALVDLGCGDGRLTALAHQQLGTASALGVDSSPAMLADTPTVDGLTFEEGDLATFERPAAYDVVLANASLHWVPDHEAVLARWVRSLRPGGQLAVQVPANADHPSHTVLSAITEELGIEAEPDPVAVNVLRPEGYAAVLDELGATEQHVRLLVYAHRLETSAEVVEWVKGTTLTRVRKVTDDAAYEAFLERYRAALLDVIGDQAPYTYLFKRILLRARF